jgi:hypothetical protein
VPKSPQPPANIEAEIKIRISVNRENEWGPAGVEMDMNRGLEKTHATHNSPKN